MTRILSKHQSRLQGSAALRLLLAIAGVCSLGLAGPVSRADEIDVSVRARAQRLAVTVCGTCHGASGNSTQPKYPRLAGQKASYLVTQLKAFRSQSRGDPDAISYMWGMASELDDVTIDALAAYYASQRAEPSSASPSSLAPTGKDIYERGIGSEGVPACSSCHGPEAHGLQEFPRLAGQHRQYVLKQLASFQSNMRNVAVMHGVAQNLRTADMQAVAAYLESLP
jgi:cytochrome c553